MYYVLLLQVEIRAALQEEAARDAPSVQIQEVSTCHNFKQLPYWKCQPYFRSTRLEALTQDAVSL